ncbi:TPA: hypothetical protein VB881_001208 [Streptococcus suis]|nr:hypothetical protein [Streptococcus suis]
MIEMPKTKPGRERKLVPSRMPYSPKDGKRIIGQLLEIEGTYRFNEHASLSAWEHVNLHTLDDYEAGFSGARIFQDLNEHWRREKCAYDLEIRLAKRLNNDELVDKLKLNRTREWNKIYRRR